MFVHHIRWIGGKYGSVKTIVSKHIISGIPTISKCKNNERIFHKWKGLCTLINSDIAYIDDPMYTSASFKKLANWISYKDSQGAGIMEVVAQIEEYRPEVFELLANDIEKEFKIPLVKQKREKNIRKSKENFIEHSSAGFMYHLTDTIAKIILQKIKN